MSNSLLKKTEWQWRKTSTNNRIKKLLLRHFLAVFHSLITTNEGSVYNNIYTQQMYSISAMMCKKTTIKSNVGLLQTIKLFKLTCNLMNKRWWITLESFAYSSNFLTVKITCEKRNLNIFLVLLVSKSDRPSLIEDISVTKWYHFKNSFLCNRSLS